MQALNKQGGKMQKFIGKKITMVKPVSYNGGAIILNKGSQHVIKSARRVFDEIESSIYNVYSLDYKGHTLEVVDGDFKLQGEGVTSRMSRRLDALSY